MAKGGRLATRIIETNPNPVIGVIHLRHTKALFYCRTCVEMKSVTAVEGPCLRLTCGHCRTMDGTAVNTEVSSVEEIAA
jgi:hypothetical protein